MKHVVLGIAAELLALAGVLLLAAWIPAGLPSALYLVLAQLMATYLVHCPAHFVVGAAVGVRFRGLRLGRTTLARALPAELKGFARLLPVLSLSIDRESSVRASRLRFAAMYVSGTVASVGSAVAIAAGSTLAGQHYPLLAWAVAVAYLGFDVLFSPKSGDLKRARTALSA